MDFANGQQEIQANDCVSPYIDSSNSNHQIKLPSNIIIINNNNNKIIDPLSSPYTIPVVMDPALHIYHAPSSSSEACDSRQETTQTMSDYSTTDGNNSNNNSNNTENIHIDSTSRQRQLPSLSPPIRSRPTAYMRGNGQQQQQRQQQLQRHEPEDLLIPDLSIDESQSSESNEKWVLSRSLAWSQDSMDRNHRIIRVPSSTTSNHLQLSQTNYRFQRHYSFLIDSGAVTVGNTATGEVSPTSTCLYWEEKLESSVPFPEY